VLGKHREKKKELYLSDISYTKVTTGLMGLNLDYKDYNIMITAKLKKRILSYMFCK